VIVNEIVIMNQLLFQSHYLLFISCGIKVRGGGWNHNPTATGEWKGGDGDGLRKGFK